MTIEEMISLLQGFPADALIVFEDCTSPDQEDEFSYETFLAEENADGEVVLRLV